MYILILTPPCTLDYNLQLSGSISSAAESHVPWRVSRTIAIKQFSDARQTPLSCPKHAARLHIEIAASQIAGKDSVSDSDLAK